MPTSNAFKEFERTQNQKRDEVAEKYALKAANIPDFFEYDTLKAHEKDFCPLYAQGIKCHDLGYLNCYFCACPYYIYKDSKTLCKINSRFAYYHKGVLDCSNCYIPHRKGFVKARLKTFTSKS